MRFGDYSSVLPPIISLKTLSALRRFHAIYYTLTGIFYKLLQKQTLLVNFRMHSILLQPNLGSRFRHKFSFLWQNVRQEFVSAVMLVCTTLVGRGIPEVGQLPRRHKATLNIGQKINPTPDMTCLAFLPFQGVQDDTTTLGYTFGHQYYYPVPEYTLFVL